MQVGTHAGFAAIIVLAALQRSRFGFYLDSFGFWPPLICLLMADSPKTDDPAFTATSNIRLLPYSLVAGLQVKMIENLLLFYHICYYFYTF